MSVGECQQKVSLLEYRVWMYRLGQELGEPSRSDYYLMRIAAEVRRLYKLKIKDTSPTSLSDFELPLVRHNGTEVPKKNYATQHDTETATVKKTKINPADLAKDPRVLQAKARWGTFLAASQKKKKANG